MLTLSALAAMLSVAAVAQNSAKPAEELPDAPAATAAAQIVPTGPRVVMETSMGRITCQFFDKQAPKAVANFIALAEGTKDWTDPATGKKQHGKRYYDGTVFHRVIPEFMIQGGDPTGTGMGDPGYTFDDEFDANLNFDQPGRLAMANSGPNTNGSQFFITEQGYDSLNQHYTIFGQCDESSVLVVKTIARVERNDRDKPMVPVTLKSVTIVREGQPLPAKPGEAAPAPAGAAPKKISISVVGAAGLLISKTAPVYPPEAKQAGISGTVVFQAVIDTTGSVKSLTVVSGPAQLQAAALEAVKTWKYRPYLLNGAPVEVNTTINVIFTLGA